MFKIITILLLTIFSVAIPKQDDRNRHVTVPTVIDEGWKVHSMATIPNYLFVSYKEKYGPQVMVRAMSVHENKTKVRINCGKVGGYIKIDLFKSNLTSMRVKHTKDL